MLFIYIFLKKPIEQRIPERTVLSFELSVDQKNCKGSAEITFSFSNFVCQAILLRDVTVVILFFRMSSKTQETHINAGKIMPVSQTLEQLVCKTIVMISTLVGALIKASQIHGLHKLLTGS